MNWLLEPLYQHVHDLGWRDLLEITFFSLMVYGLQLWLRHDTQKPLLGYWYTYCGVWATASWLGLSTISFALLMLLPAAITMFVLIHQRTLQKNYIALKTVRSASLPSDNWLDALMQTALIKINANRPFLAIIEHQDALDAMLTTTMPLHATLKKELLVLLLDSMPAEQEYAVWLTMHGIIRGINAQWATSADVVNKSVELATWQQDALFFTALTDAVVLYANTRNRTFTLVAQGKSIEHMTAQSAQRFIKQHHTSSLSAKSTKGDTIHGYCHTQTNHTKQPMP
ncbi:MAG: hypothetical protein IT346_01510 [Epsilonproteobacteria bacterium]|nr:hypothetical protein [Campylobacterota bacterium]